MLKKIVIVLLFSCQAIAMYEQLSGDEHFHDRFDDVYTAFKKALNQHPIDQQAALKAAKILVQGDKERAVTPLMYAVDNGTPELVKAMLDLGFQVNATSTVTGDTCLHYLATSANPEAVDIAKLLKEQPGVDLSLRDKNNQTAAVIATAFNNHELAQVLEPTGQTNAKSPREKTLAGAANFKKRNSFSLEEQSRPTSTWTVFKYFLGGMGLAATFYYIYDKCFKEHASA